MLFFSFLSVFCDYEVCFCINDYHERPCNIDDYTELPNIESLYQFNGSEAKVEIVSGKLDDEIDLTRIKFDALHLIGYRQEIHAHFYETLTTAKPELVIFENLIIRPHIISSERTIYLNCLTMINSSFYSHEKTSILYCVHFDGPAQAFESFIYARLDSFVISMRRFEDFPKKQCRVILVSKALFIQKKTIMIDEGSPSITYTQNDIRIGGLFELSGLDNQQIGIEIRTKQYSGDFLFQGLTRAPYQVSILLFEDSVINIFEMKSTQSIYQFLTFLVFSNTRFIIKGYYLPMMINAIQAQITLEFSCQFIFISSIELDNSSLIIEYENYDRIEITTESIYFEKNSYIQSEKRILLNSRELSIKQTQYLQAIKGPIEFSVFEKISNRGIFQLGSLSLSDGIFIAVEEYTLFGGGLLMASQMLVHPKTAIVFGLIRDQMFLNEGLMKNIVNNTYDVICYPELDCKEWNLYLSDSNLIGFGSKYDLIKPSCNQRGEMNCYSLSVTGYPSRIKIKLCYSNSSESCPNEYVFIHLKNFLKWTDYIMGYTESVELLFQMPSDEILNFSYMPFRVPLIIVKSTNKAILTIDMTPKSQRMLNQLVLMDVTAYFVTGDSPLYLDFPFLNISEGASINGFEYHVLSPNIRLDVELFAATNIPRKLIKETNMYFVSNQLRIIYLKDGWRFINTLSNQIIFLSKETGDFPKSLYSPGDISIIIDLNSEGVYSGNLSITGKKQSKAYVFVNGRWPEYKSSYALILDQFNSAKVEIASQNVPIMLHSIGKINFSLSSTYPAQSSIHIYPQQFSKDPFIIIETNPKVRFIFSDIQATENCRIDFLDYSNQIPYADVLSITYLKEHSISLCNIALIGSIDVPSNCSLNLIDCIIKECEISTHIIHENESSKVTIGYKQVIPAPPKAFSVKSVLSDDPLHFNKSYSIVNTGTKSASSLWKNLIILNPSIIKTSKETCNLSLREIQTAEVIIDVFCIGFTKESSTAKWIIASLSILVIAVIFIHYFSSFCRKTENEGQLNDELVTAHHDMMYYFN